VSDRALEGFLRLLEMTIVALQNRQVHERCGELRILQRELLEAEFGLDRLAGAHVAHDPIEVRPRRR